MSLAADVWNVCALITPVVEAMHQPSLSTHKPPFTTAIPACVLPFPTIIMFFRVDGMPTPNPAVRPVEVATKNPIVEVAPPLPEIEIIGWSVNKLEVPIA